MEILKKSSARLYQDYKEAIADILLFGSFVKGKFSPRDIDVAIFLTNAKEAELADLIAKFSSYFGNDVHLNLMPLSTIFRNPLLKTIINEGISLLDNKPLHQILGYESGAVFSISLKKLEKSRKVLFSYALHGKKGQQGMLERIAGKELGRSVFFIPASCTDGFRQFLEQWNIDFYMMSVLRG